jgi:hypothetical protein
MSIFHHFYSGALFNKGITENCCFQTEKILKVCENTVILGGYVSYLGSLLSSWQELQIKHGVFNLV